MEKDFRPQEPLVANVDGERLLGDAVGACVLFDPLCWVLVIFCKLFDQVGADVPCRNECNEASTLRTCSQHTLAELACYRRERERESTDEGYCVPPVQRRVPPAVSSLELTQQQQQQKQTRRGGGGGGGQRHSKSKVAMC